MLDEIRAAGETIPEACEIFNANLEMSGDEITFEEVIEVRISTMQSSQFNLILYCGYFWTRAIF